MGLRKSGRNCEVVLRRGSTVFLPPQEIAAKSSSVAVVVFIILLGESPQAGAFLRGTQGEV